MSRVIHNIIRLMFGSLRDLAPVILTVAFFQLFVLQQPLPDVSSIISGLFMVLLGLALFVQGLESGLFPIGEAMADALAHRGSLVLLLAFAFLLGFGTTIAEPALIAVAGEAAMVASVGGIIADDDAVRANYVFWLRITVALSVGIALLIGVLRIVLGWPVQYVIMGGYLMVVVMTFFAPPEIVGVAYDSGGVTTSTITVPLVTALGIGLAKAIRGRNPVTDGFGLIAFASLLPIVFVLAFGRIWPHLAPHLK